MLLGVALLIGLVASPTFVVRIAHWQTTLYAITNLRVILREGYAGARQPGRPAVRDPGSPHQAGA